MINPNLSFCKSIDLNWCTLTMTPEVLIRQYLYQINTPLISFYHLKDSLNQVKVRQIKTWLTRTESECVYLSALINSPHFPSPFKTVSHMLGKMSSSGALSHRPSTFLIPLTIWSRQSLSTAVRPWWQRMKTVTPVLFLRVMTSMKAETHKPLLTCYEQMV